MKTRTIFSSSASHPLARRDSVCGFTLVELIITVLITGILAAAALPAYTGFVASQRVKAASFEIMSSLILTRSEALKRNITVSLAPTGGSWTNGMQVIDSNGIVVSKLNPATGVVVTCKQSSVTVTCPTFNYNPSGRIAGAATSIQISNTSATNLRCISLALSGRPNAKVGACS